MKLGSLIRVRTGKIDANAAVKNGLYPFFTCSKEISKINKYEFDCECVLIAGNGDLNIKYYNGKFNAYQRTYIIESIDKNKLSVKFLYYFFLWYIEVLRYKSIGGVIKYIKIKDITDVNLVLPAIDEQKELVEFFDKISVLINKKQNEFQQLNELIKSRFIEMFGDRLKNLDKKLSSIAIPVIGLTYKPSNVTKEGTIVLRSGNIENNELKLEEDVVRVSNIKIQEQKWIKDKDILMCSRNGSAHLVGKSCLIRNPKEQMSFGAFMTVIRTKYPYFLQSFFTSDYFKCQLNDIGTASVNQITSRMLNNYDAIEPIEAEEKEFEEYVKQIDKLKFVCYSKYFLCDILTFESSTIAYSSVVSIFACPNIF